MELNNFENLSADSFKRKYGAYDKVPNQPFKDTKRIMTHEEVIYHLKKHIGHVIFHFHTQPELNYSLDQTTQTTVFELFMRVAREHIVAFITSTPKEFSFYCFEHNGLLHVYIVRYMPLDSSSVTHTSNTSNVSYTSNTNQVNNKPTEAPSNTQSDAKSVTPIATTLNVLDTLNSVDEIDSYIQDKFFNVNIDPENDTRPEMPSQEAIDAMTDEEQEIVMQRISEGYYKPDASSF